MFERTVTCMRAVGHQSPRCSSRESTPTLPQAVLPLYQVHEHAIQALGMHEADQGTARAWPAGCVDQRMARALQARKRAVDVGHLERDVMQPGPAGGDKAADGALILSCAAGTTVCHLAALARIDILEKLDFTVADGDEGHAQSAHWLRRSRVVDHTVRV
jgi:hypothetical protein